MDKNVILTLIIGICIMSAGLNSANTNTYVNLDRTEEMNTSNSLVQDLYELDPSNPTQILKAQVNKRMDSLKKQNKLPSTSSPETLIKKSDELYQTIDFWTIESFTTTSYNYIKVQAQLLAIGDFSYVYVATKNIDSAGFSGAKSKAETYRDHFETNIYPMNIQYFGHPDGYLGDIDGDPRVTIFLISLDGDVAGYFDPTHEYARTNSNPYSNERELVHVNFDYLTGNQRFSVLTHEFQHLIHFNHDPYELWFVDEGCAELATYVTGYLSNSNLTPFTNNFKYNSQDSLLFWNYYSESGYDVTIDYGGAYLFMFYIAEKYGANTVKDIVSNTFVGAEGIGHSLNNNGHTISFNQLYLNWITALTIDEPSIDTGIYGFDNIDFKIMDYQLSESYPVSKETHHRYYGMSVSKMDNAPDNVIFSIDTPINYYLGTSVIVKNQTGFSITQEINSKDSSTIVKSINGTNIQTVYVVRSLMENKIPRVSWNEQFGLGYYEYLSYSISPGVALNFQNDILKYEPNEWIFSIFDLKISYPNGTEITADNNLDVFIQFIDSWENKLYTEMLMNYSSDLKWNINASLQSFDESTYNIHVSVNGENVYGLKKYEEEISVQHLLTIDEPEYLENTAHIYAVSVNASYTQLISRELFAQKAEVTLFLYFEDDDSLNDYILLSYSPITNNWQSSNIDLSDKPSGYYSFTVRFKYAERSIETNKTTIFVGCSTPTTFVSFQLGITIWLSFLLLAICIDVKRK